MEKFPELQALIDKNPSILAMLQEQVKEKKQSKRKVEHGQVIELPIIPTPEDGSPVPISMSIAKKLLKGTSRRPRTLTEESRFKMLANLQKGREALMQKKKGLIQVHDKKNIGTSKPMQQSIVANKPTQATQKYIIEPPKIKKQKKESSSSLDYSMEVQKNEALLKRIEQMQQNLHSSRSTSNPPPLKRSKAYSLFF